MTTAPTPEEVRALAERLEHCVAKWGKQNALSLEAYSAVKMMRRLHAENERLRGQLGRFQGVPLPLIEAINTATGSNDWQGDHSPAELLEPACRAIAELETRKPLTCVPKLGPTQRGDKCSLGTVGCVVIHDDDERKPLPLSDEQIDAIADGMPGGLGGFLKTWGWRQFARKILDLRAPPTWEPGFDCMVPGQEELAMEFCLEIAGPRGQPGRNPDPVRLLEMAEALYKAEADARGITGGSS